MLAGSGIQAGGPYRESWRHQDGTNAVLACRPPGIPGLSLKNNMTSLMNIKQH